jgi:HSP20 family protein
LHLGISGSEKYLGLNVGPGVIAERRCAMFGLMSRKSATKPVPREEFPIRLWRDGFEELINRFMGRWPVAQEWEWTPPTWGLDLKETEKEVTVRAEAPGFEPADFDVRVAGDVLTIAAEHKTVKGKEGEKDKEERHLTMKRTVTLPPGTELEKVEAIYRNGVLELKMPRKPEAIGMKIPVKT